MTEIKIPKILIPLTTSNYKEFNISCPGNALFLFDDSPQELSVFRTPFSLVKHRRYGLGIEVVGDGMGDVGWWIREYCKRNKDLEGIFSEELITMKLKDNRKRVYELHCSQTFAISAKYGIDPENAYFLNVKKNDLRAAFHFGSNKLLSRLNSAGFSEEIVKRVGDFFYEDFTTLKHSEESRKIGQEADAIFC